MCNYFRAMEHEEKLHTGLTQILSVALPISLGIFVQFIVVFIDNYFVAQVSGNAMSAVAFVGLMYVTLAMLGVGLGNATQILVARRKGEGRYEEVGKVVGNSLWMAGILALIQFSILFFLLPGIVDAVIDSPQIGSYMKEFAYYRSFGFLFYTLTLVLNSFWSGIAHTRVMMYTTAITAGVTIVLDYLLVFGNWGMPALGVEGAAIATSLAELCAFCFLLLYTLYHSDKQLNHSRSSSHSYEIKKNLMTFVQSETKTIFKLGGPISLQLLASLGIWAIFYEFVESMGEQPLQSSFIVRNMYMLAYVSVGGFSTTTKTYVSGLIAEKRQHELKSLIRKMALLNFTGIIFLSHGLWLYPETIAGMFTSDPLVIQQTIDTMHIVLPAMLTFSITSILLSTVEGSGNTMAGFIIELLAIVVYIVTAWAMVYAWHWPIHLVWTSDYIYFIMLGIFSIAYLWNGKWMQSKL